MRITNIHGRTYPVPPEAVGRLLDSLASRDDRLWPHRLWPRMHFDKPLSVSANGGHGPIRYVVEAYQPGERVRFRFTGPKGFDGFHGYEVFDLGEGRAELRETLKMHTHGLAVISWPLLYAPLHDALIEDSLSFAQLHLGLEPDIRPWSTWVRLLRWLISRGSGRKQKIA